VRVYLSSSSSPSPTANPAAGIMGGQNDITSTTVAQSSDALTTEKSPASTRASPNATSWYSRMTNPPAAANNGDDDTAFRGRSHWNGQTSYWHPRKRATDIEQGTEQGKRYDYKNTFGHTSSIKNHGLETYLSSTKYKPRKLIVQASVEGRLEETCDWNRTRIKGVVPKALQTSEWALEPGFPKSRYAPRVRWIGVPLTILRIFLIAIPLQFYMSFPIFTAPWQDDDAQESYMTWPGYLWQWPKFAVNPLDMSPSSPDRFKPSLSAQSRLLRPRLLRVWNGSEWQTKDLDQEPEAYCSYVMISYTNAHFFTNIFPGASDSWTEGRNELKRIAEMQARLLGLNAYWLDFECRALENGPLLNSDVNRFCDVVRGAARVVVALPDDRPETAIIWGKRMWTLPEGLLAPGPKVTVHYVKADEKTQDKVTEFTKVEMAQVFWSQTNNSRDGADVEATRLLAEHFTGTVTLSRLQLMSTAIVALWDRKDFNNKHTPAELAHALMGLLHTRLDPVPSNKLFQDIAKLSLLNDSDKLIERMICLLPADGSFVDGDAQADNPDDAYDNSDPFRSLASPDQFQTHLWDIQPTCEVVGVDFQDRTVIVNNAKAIAIRWKSFPRIKYARTASFKKFLAELFLRSGTWWFLYAFGLIYTYVPLWISVTPTDGSSSDASLNIHKWLGYGVLFFFLVGTTLSLLGPLSMRILYGGITLSPAPHLVGFEGTMPVDKLEKLIFGNDDGRLNYEPSSSILALPYRDENERRGSEPEWVKDARSNPAPTLLPGQRLFTIVDTGNMSVSVIAARYPPTVALICGHEGGMLRTVLCRWDARNDCLRKETVMRMPSDTADMAATRGWLRLRLG